MNVGSLPIGIFFAVITSICLNALLEGVEILEDPFVAFVTLDGIDVREEFQVLHWQQLVSARNNIFSEAMPYGSGAARFAIAEEESLVGGDIESQLGQHQQQQHNDHAGTKETPLGNASEASHASRRRIRHRTLPSLGDANFLAGIEDDVELYRESGYQLCGRNKKDLDVTPPSAGTLPKVVSTDGAGQRPSSY